MAYELAFVLSGESDDLEAALQRSAASVEDLEDAAKGLTSTQLRWNDATGQFVDQQGDFVSQLTAGKQLREELNALGIRTTEQIEDEVQALRVLETAYQDDARVAALLRQRQARLNEELEEGANASYRAAGGMSRGAMAAQEASFILNDLQQFSFGAAEGIRAISNNVPQLLFPLIGGGVWGMGLIAALSAGATAFTFFSDRAESAGSVASDTAGSIGSLVNELIKLEGREGGAVRIERSQIPAALELMEERVEQLREQQDDYTQTLQRQARTISRQLQDMTRVEKVRAVQEGLVTEEMIRQRKAAKERSEMAHQQLDAAEAVLEWLEEQNKKLIEERRLRRELARTGAMQLTQITEALDKQAEMEGEVKFLATAEGARLLQIRRQNMRLEEQLDFISKINKQRALGIPRSAVAGPTFGGEEVPVEGTGATEEQIEHMARNLPGVGGAAAEAAQGINQFSDANQNLKETLIQLDQPMEQLFASLPALAAGTQDIASVAGGILGTFAQQVGKTMIAFGLTGEAIKNFTTNPWTAVIAGGSLIALGSLLKQRVQSQADSFTSGAGFSQGGFGAPIQNSGSGSRMSNQALVGAGSRPSFGGPASGASGRQGPQVVTLRHEHTFSNFQLRGQDLLASVERTATIRESGRPTMREIQLK